MIVKCEDVFVDSLTGEIINPLDYCLPEGYDVSPAVTEALTGLPLKGTYTTTGEIKKGKGRKPKVLVNTYCSLFQNLERKDVREGANKQVISSQADSLIKISRIWADFFPANTSNQPI